MNNMFLCDSHIHSKYSFDGSEEIYNLYLSAKQKGLGAIAITDHYDCCENMDYQKQINDFKQRNRDINNILGLFKNRIKIFKGIELGQPIDNYTAANKMLDEVDFDFTLLSLHNLTGEPDFYYMDNFEKRYVYKMLDRYFDELIELLDFDRFDSLAHLTYPLRYIIPNVKFDFDILRFNHKIDEILKKLIKKNKALEINTSGLSQTISQTLPSIDIVRRFKRFGGKYITIGSDAHTHNNIGSHLKSAVILALNAGFETITVYDKHKPIVQRIIL